MKMFYRFFTSALLCFTVTIQVSEGGTTDRTMEHKAYGVEVVHAVVRKIRRSQIFSDDYEFLKRLAFMESKYGENLNDQSDNFAGGIWQLTENEFRMTKSGKLAAFHAEILKTFDINWLSVSYLDLLKPLYSGLARRLHLQLITPSIPQTVAKQSILWKQAYNKNPLRPSTDFIDQITYLENNTATCNGLFDLTVVLDGSGSIGFNDFQIAKDFVAKLFDTFSTDAVRKSFILFGFDAYMIFPLNSNYSPEQIRSVVQGVKYPSEATNTNAGILMAVNMIQSTNMKPGVPSIVIVFTDGESNVGDGVSNIRFAKQANITTFAIGIGPRLNMTELLEIAYNDSSHLMIVHDFNTLATLTNRLNAEACLVSQKPEVGETVTDKLTKDENRYYAFPITQNGITVVLNNTDGSVDGYYSFTEENPSKSVHDGVLNDDETFIKAPYGPSSNGNGIIDDYELHVGLYGKEGNNNYSIVGYEGFGKPPEKNKTDGDGNTENDLGDDDDPLKPNSKTKDNANALATGTNGNSAGSSGGNANTGSQGDSGTANSTGSLPGNGNVGNTGSKGSANNGNTATNGNANTGSTGSQGNANSGNTESSQQGGANNGNTGSQGIGDNGNTASQGIGNNGNTASSLGNTATGNIAGSSLGNSTNGIGGTAPGNSNSTGGSTAGLSLDSSNNSNAPGSSSSPTGNTAGSLGSSNPGGIAGSSLGNSSFSNSAGSSQGNSSTGSSMPGINSNTGGFLPDGSTPGAVAGPNSPANNNPGLTSGGANGIISENGGAGKTSTNNPFGTSTGNSANSQDNQAGTLAQNGLFSGQSMVNGTAGSSNVPSNGQDSSNMGQDGQGQWMGNQGTTNRNNFNGYNKGQGGNGVGNNSAGAGNGSGNRNGGGGVGGSGIDFSRLPNIGSFGHGNGNRHKCKDNQVLFQSFPGRCDLYTLCACGVKVLLECAPGLYFDPVISMCNFIQLVDCPDSDYPNLVVNRCNDSS